MDADAFSEAARIFQNYAAVHTATKTWLFAQDIEETEKKRLMDIQENYLYNRVIPKTLQGLQLIREEMKSLVNSREIFTTDELFTNVNRTLEDFTPRELICNVGFTEQGIGLCTDFIKSVGGQRALNLCKKKKEIIKDRVFVLKSDSDTDWFKRRSYGESMRKHAFILPFNYVQPEMSNIIESKLQEIAPEANFELGNYAEQLNQHFDKLCGQKKQESAISQSVEMQELLQATKGFNKEDIKRLTQIAKSPELQALLQEANGLGHNDMKRLELMAKNLKSSLKSSESFDSGLTPSPSKKTRREQVTKLKSCSRKLFTTDQQKMLEETDSE